MRWEQLVGVTGSGTGSGYLIAPRLVLTSAHVVGEDTTEVTVIRPGRCGVYSAKVAWCGHAGGIDDAALVEVDDPAWMPPQMRPVVWGRIVTQQPGIKCRTWGLPDFAQCEGTATDTEQPTGTLNPGDSYGRQHIIHLIEHPPTALGESPWKGISGAAVYCESLLTGVVATDPAHRDHAALGIVPAYVLLAQPGFREVVEQHCGTVGLQWAPVELQELADHQSPTRAATTPGTPATLLTARRAVVEFRGRDHLLNELRDWVDEPGVGAWLIHGAGGQGKTRLAHHLGTQLAARRWSVLWLDPAIVTAEQLRVLGQVVTPLLVIIDYAEARVPQTGTLFAELVTHVGDRPVKVLLLARTVGEWWTQLGAASDTVGDVTARARVTALPPLNDGPEAREATYRDTVRAMAATLPVLGDPTTVQWEEAAHRVLTQPYRDLGDNTTVLGVQMNALADLLDIGHDSPTSIGRQSLEDRVLEHEHRYWTATATRDGLDSLGMTTLKDALVATIVLAATTSKELEKALARIPDLADQPRLTRTKVQTWLMSLYPGDTHGIYAGPTPDRLAEQLVGRSMLDLTRDSVVESLAAIIDEVEAEHLLTVCTRATAHPSLMPAAGESLTEICVNHPDMLLPAAVRIAPQVENPAPLIAALDRVGVDSRVGIDLLDKLLEAIPPDTQVLAAPAITIGNELIVRLKDLAGTAAADRVKLATVLAKTAQWQRRKDYLGDALASATEAVAINRELNGAQQVDQMAGLAKALTTQAAVLGDLRRYDQSLPAASEAVEIFRGLFGRDPETHLIDFVAALYVLTRQMRESGLGAAAALDTATEGIVMVRSLVEEQRSSTARSRLAACLIAVGVEHYAAGRHTNALEAGAEALDIYRELAESRPDAYAGEHAMALNNMSIFLSAAGRHGDAIQSIEESIEIHRDLATKYPDGNLNYLGSSLQTLAVRYIEQNEFDKAYGPACESLNILRQLAEVNLEAYEPLLGSCLHNFAYILIELGRAPEARESAVQAVDIHRRLSRQNPINDPEALAACLNTLGRIQERTGQLSLALGSVTEAVELQRSVAEDSQSSRSNLAAFLTNLARYRGKAGDRSAGLDAIAEALTIYEGLIIESPGTYDALLDQARRVRDKFDL
ncbi:tetratricopeptide repeat protein [Nocardia bhagyanarayanae]|uniref:Tetratricopeptide repeat protein n=1 Tax=Nocardia bhagyanarayanae TaxID=1215925 RepID=A0A543F4W1_9NOCA|nr:tetratricopeptide repeat protein [Nocardia bhagyanarayanae]TQM28860.1 tetratricopeptide repeat protein [Nocardia bhagyanarayanae]